MTRASEHSTALVTCETTKGQIVMEFFRDWSPLGFERAVELFDRGFYDHSHFFRVVHGFLVQFGISYTTDKELQEFADSTIPDDPVNEDLAFEEGIISFAGSGKNSRTSHLFIAYGAIPSLGKMPWETPVGKILMGTDVIRNLNGEYGDGAPNGNGPPQYMIKNGGIEYMNKKFPNLDSFITCSVDSDSDDGNGNEAEEKADDDDATNPDKAKNEEEEVDEVAKNAEDTAVVARATAVDAKKRLGLGNGDENGNGNGDGNGDVTSNVHVPIMAAVLVFLAIVLTMRRRQKKVQTKMG